MKKRVRGNVDPYWLFRSRPVILYYSSHDPLNVLPKGRIIFLRENRRVGEEGWDLCQCTPVLWTVTILGH